MTGSLSGIERPLSEHEIRIFYCIRDSDYDTGDCGTRDYGIGDYGIGDYGIRVATRVSWRPPSHRYAITIGLRGSSSGSR